jgi:hypothetical protein
MQTTCVVNSVGPTSGDFESNFLDPRDDPISHGPVVILTLTARDNTLQSFAFLVGDSINAPSGISNSVLAVALAAISTGKQVMADVDWPPQTIELEGGDIVNLPAIAAHYGSTPTQRRMTFTIFTIN